MGDARVRGSVRTHGRRAEPARDLDLVVSPGVGLTVSATGTDQFVGDVTWVNWNRPYWTERLKQGAEAVRDAALELTRPA